jgi:hypothetical protein
MFRVGASKYIVKIAMDRMRVAGEECMGLCDERGRRILINPVVPVDRRLWTLAHELAHAHVLATGMPADVESLCDMFATMFELTSHDLTNAGGEEALKRLDPGETFGTPTARIMLTRSRPCAQCGATIAPGNMTCTPTGDGHVEIRVPCAHCDVTAYWREIATHGGLPSGVVVGDPRIVRARDDQGAADGELRYVACE